MVDQVVLEAVAEVTLPLEAVAQVRQEAHQLYLDPQLTLEQVVAELLDKETLV